ncbi:MAG: Eco57I restriction-modification methylase domain-containing protein [Roseiflexus sp.]|nr:Eco57I restriction-modification methylase domain-containing protein [Roseiflexus sp.]
MTVICTSNKPTGQRNRESLGQFFTPPHVADLMASWVDPLPERITLLDAGAGTGALIAALVRRICRMPGVTRQLRVTAFEIDPSLAQPLAVCMASCQRMCESSGISFSADIRQADFIATAAPIARGDLFAESLPPFNVALVNPPYRKIRSDSAERLHLRSAGIETSNLYAGFLALIIRLLAPGGQLVSITPRSFCNGPYFRPFREDLLNRMTIRRIHVFDSRSAVFEQDDVLQETIIMDAVKSAEPCATIRILSSAGAPESAVRERHLPQNAIICSTGTDRFIHIPADDTALLAREWMGRLPATLHDLGLVVSTGRVVDFRARPFLRDEPTNGTVPLIYPHHIRGAMIDWPRDGMRKPQAIVRCGETADLLVPAGVYVLVKRFTAKEERRRLVAALYDPTRIPYQEIGFENHLNYIHAYGRGLSPALARGLTLFFNSTWADHYFRALSGHTQVNAADLRAFRYPDREALERIGRAAPTGELSQVEVDAIVIYRRPATGVNARRELSQVEVDAIVMEIANES